jgi:broad specificity phosphatase PhoE
LAAGSFMAEFYSHKLIFLRHGQTAYNFESRLQGQRDVSLDGKGREQAGAVGRFLGDSLGAQVARLESANGFWASPLGRARQTMEIARAAMGLGAQPYHLDGRLLELSFGDWEGMTWDQIESAYPGAIETREADKWNYTPPGGESYAELTERVRAWLSEREDDTLVVSHGGVARALMALLAGVEPLVAAEAPIRQGRALIFENGACAWLG